MSSVYLDLYGMMTNRYNFKAHYFFSICRNIVREPRYAFHNGNCNKLIPDAEGNVPKTRWVVHARKYVYLCTIL